MKDMKKEFVWYPVERSVRDGRRSPLDDRVIPICTEHDQAEDEKDVEATLPMAKVFQDNNAAKAAEKKNQRSVRFALTPVTIDDTPSRGNDHRLYILPNGTDKHKDRLSSSNDGNGDEMVDLNDVAAAAELKHEVAVGEEVLPLIKGGEQIAADKKFMSAVPDSGETKGTTNGKKTQKAKKMESAKIGPTPSETSEPINSQFSEIQMRSIIRSSCVERYRLNDFERYIQPSQQEETKKKSTIKQSLKKKLEQFAFNIPDKTNTTRMEERTCTVAPRHMGEDAIKSQVKSVSELDEILSKSTTENGNSANSDDKIKDGNDKHNKKLRRKKKCKKNNKKASELITESKQAAKDANGEKKSKMKNVWKRIFRKQENAKVGPTPGEKLEPLNNLTEAELKSKVMEFCVEESFYDYWKSSANSKAIPKLVNSADVEITAGKYVRDKNVTVNHSPTTIMREDSDATSAIGQHAIGSTVAYEIESEVHNAYKEPTVEHIMIRPAKETSTATSEASASANTNANEDSNSIQLAVDSNEKKTEEETASCDQTEGITTRDTDAARDANKDVDENKELPEEHVDLRPMRNRRTGYIVLITYGVGGGPTAVSIPIDRNAPATGQPLKQKKRNIFRRLVDRIFRKKKATD